MFRAKYCFLACLLFGLTVAPVCADELFSFKASYQKLNPDGDFAVSSDSLPGTSIDLDDDLGYDDSEDYYLEAALQLGSFRLFAAYQPINFSGDGVLAETVDFNGETFVAGSHVESDIDIDIYEAGLAWYLVNVDDLPVRVQLGPEVAVKYIDASIDLADTFTGVSESESVKAPVPTVGLRGRVAVADLVGVVGRVGYLDYSGNSFLDVDAQVEFSPVPMVGVFAGYRYLDIDIDEDDVIIDASFDGPYVGAMVRF
jgi:outer membrane protein